VVLVLGLLAIVGSIGLPMSVDGQSRERPERSGEDLQRLEARQRQLDVVSEAASREVRVERNRRKAPFDLSWGLR